jgi:membrane protein EpsK
MQLVVAPLGAILSTVPLLYVVMAVNAVRTPALVTVVVGAINVLLIFLFTGYLGWGLYGIALASMVAMFGKNLVFLPLYVCGQIGQPALRVLVTPCIVALATAVVWISSSLIGNVFQLSSWYHLGAATAVTASIYLSITYYLLLTSREKSFLEAVASRLFSRRPAVAPAA